MKKISVFDFFSGCGGTSEGFRQAGLDIVFGLDSDLDAAKTFQLNFPTAKFINDDIRNVTINNINNLYLEAKSVGLVLFCGCAPCQPFSTQNTKKIDNDPRRYLLSYFSDFIKFFKPDFVFIENVPGIQKVGKYSTPFFEFLDLLNAEGYSYDFDVVSSLNYGVPQDRKRLILIGSNKFKIKLPIFTHDGKSVAFSTVRDWIYHLPKIANGEKHEKIKDHHSAKLGELNLKRIISTPEGGGRESWDDSLKADCHKRNTGYRDVYGRLSWDKPSSVLTTRCTSYSNGRFGHPEQHRALSLREAALLQTFPIDYDFFGSFTSKSKQIGNAVPPLMAKAVGKYLLDILDNTN